MATNVNIVRNPDFSRGRDAPRYWEAYVEAGSCDLDRRPRSIDGPAFLAIIPRAPAPAFFRQVVRCKPDAYYRVEAVVRCELVPAGPSAGFVLALQYKQGTDQTSLSTPPVYDSPEPVAVRTYFHAPSGCKEMLLSVGVCAAVGVAEILEVRLIRILEPDELSHPLAVLPPYCPTPKPIESACVCSSMNGQRPLICLLRLALGERNVSALPPASLNSAQGEAILLPDASPPPQLNSLKALLKVAEDRLVVISLPAFAKLARGVITIRRIEQPDDPIHAKIAFANEATRGFTLHDSFAYAWPGKARGSFVQNQFRKNEPFSRFCQKHHFITLLVSNCDKDRTSDQPICIYRPSPRGGLYVLDLDPVEASASTMSEPTLAAHLLLSMLHRSASPAGQFTVPVRTQADFQEMIGEAANRWDHYYVQEDDSPAGEVSHQLVTVGREDEMYGLPIAAKPVVLLRSGLVGGDAPAVYGVWSWLRQLLLHSRHPNSYAAALASRFRFSWIPSLSAWEIGDGWAPSEVPPANAMEGQIDDARVAALIDVCASSPDGVNVVFSEPGPTLRHAQRWLPEISAAFLQAEFPAFGCGAGAFSGSRRASSWRRMSYEVKVTGATEPFSEPIHREVLKKGGDAIRIELPRFDSDFVAHSIHFTHLAVCLIEQVIGLLYGVIAVNRTRQPVTLNGFETVEPGQSLVVPRESKIFQSPAARTG